MSCEAQRDLVSARARHPLNRRSPNQRNRWRGPPNRHFETPQALREPDLNRPRPDEQRFRELKLLVDHRDDLVDQRRRTQQRLRWHLHALDPTYAVPLRKLSRATQLDRVGRWLARQQPDMQARLARDLVGRCRALNREIAALDQELEMRATEIASPLLDLPGCAGVTAAKLLAEIGPIDRFKTDSRPLSHLSRTVIATGQARRRHVLRHRKECRCAAFFS
jgi:transposase